MLFRSYTFAKKALEKGKNFCTSNKELVAKHGPELVQLAADNNVNFLFEASVGGGIPIVRPLNASLTPEKVVEITGILNGTTNYMLTKMTNEGAEFDEVLKDAQEKGYAERNPEADIEGYDACRKIAILSSLAYGKNVDFEDIYTEGITKITDVDFKYAKELGVSIKLIGSSKKTDDGFTAMVAPKMLGGEHPLAGVNGVMNAIFVKGNVLGDVMFYGAGAGKLPTASAVVSDVVDAVRHLDSNVETKWNSKKVELVKKEEMVSKYFVRVNGEVSSKLAAVEAAFGKVETVTAEGVTGEFGFVTEEMSEKSYEEAAAKVDGIITMIRYEK